MATSSSSHLWEAPEREWDRLAGAAEGAGWDELDDEAEEELTAEESQQEFAK